VSADDQEERDRRELSSHGECGDRTERGVEQQANYTLHPPARPTAAEEYQQRIRGGCHGQRDQHSDSAPVE